MPTLRRAYSSFALAVAVVLVVLLSLEVRTVRRELRQSTSRSITLQPGEYVPELTAQTADGVRVALGGRQGVQQIYIVYTTSCPYCAESAPAWNALATEIGHFAATGFEFIGVSPDPDSALEMFVRRHSLPFPSISLDRRQLSLHKIGPVPQVLVVNPLGRVTYLRRGVLHIGSATDSIVSHLIAEGGRPGE